MNPEKKKLMHFKLLLASLAAVAALSVSCAPRPFVSLAPENGKIAQVSYPLPYIVGVEPSTELDRDYDHLGYEGDIRKDVEDHFINFMKKADYFWNVARTENLDVEPDLLCRLTVIRFDFEQRENTVMPLVYSTATLGIYPLLGGTFWTPRAYFRLGFELTDPTGRSVLAFERKSEIADDLSLYSTEENSPEVYVRRAFASVMTEISKELARSMNKIVKFIEVSAPRELRAPVILVEAPEDNSSYAIPPDRSMVPVSFNARILAREGLYTYECRLNGRQLTGKNITLDLYNRIMVFARGEVLVPGGLNYLEVRATDVIGRHERVFVKLHVEKTAPPEPPESPPGE